jgi:16S rRNA (cytidine1402-2'-O)-methyltransferase
MMSRLILVPTPIGNLEDITLREIRILKECDLILAEDTRVTAHLLKHLEISKPLKSYHQHNEHKIIDELVQQIANNNSTVLVSDAGTPAISDPGFLLVRSCIKEGIIIETLPGPTAFVPALVNSGLPCNEFAFYGFLPQKKGRLSKWQLLKDETKTFILYESPYRLIKLLEEIILHLGPQRLICVSREISKLFEENKRGEAAEVLAYFKSKTVKGELVIIIQGKQQSAVVHDEEES